MGTTLHTLAPNPGATHKKKRVGRGPGSGTGKTAGRGQKGQKARAGHHGARVGFEGGQMPMQRRLPKRGFANQFRVEAHPVNLGTLAAKLGSADAGHVVDVAALRELGLVPKKAKIIKILAQGDFSLAITVKAHRFSKNAIAKIQQAGGTAEVVPVRAGESADASGSAQTAAPTPAKPATTDAPTQAAPPPAPAATEPAAPAADTAGPAKPESSDDQAE